MLAWALDAGVAVGWVTGDEVYGANSGLRAELQAHQIGYMLAVACDHRVPFGGATPARRRPALAGPGAGMAAGVVRQGRQRRPPVPVGVPVPGPWRGCSWRPGGQALAAGPPQPRAVQLPRRPQLV
jgi:hypothetical protein